VSNQFRNKDDQNKLLSLLGDMLRIDPKHFGLTIDEFGAASLQDVTLASSHHIPWVKQEHIQQLAKNPRNHLVIEDNDIFFLNGYQYDIISPQATIPPAHLYMGINPILISTWRQKGACAFVKRFLTLYESQDEAWHFATTTESIPSPVIIAVHAVRANKAGIAFFRFERFYYCKFIPPQYLQL